MKRLYSKDDDVNVVVNIVYTKEEKLDIYQQQKKFFNHVLEESTKLMLSDDYKTRFIAERTQLVARAKLLNQTLLAYEDGILDYELHCSISLLKRQFEVMAEYAEILMERAKEENIELPDIYELFKERED